MTQPHGKYHPDKDIRGNPGSERVTIDGHCTVPEQGHQRPGERPGDGGEMHQSREGAMTPVRGVQIQVVGDEDDLRAPVVVPGPEEDPGEDEQVVQDEVGADVGGGGDDGRVSVEEMVDIAQLGEEQENPENFRDDRALRERRGVPIRLFEDGVAVLDIMRSVDGVVDADDDDK